MKVKETWKTESCDSLSGSLDSHNGVSYKKIENPKGMELVARQEAKNYSLFNSTINLMA